MTSHLLTPLFLMVATIGAAETPTSTNPPHGRVVTYPAPTGTGSMAPSGDFAVRVNGRPVDVYATRVLKPHTWGGDNGPQQFELASMAYFDFEGRVEVELTHIHPVERVDIRPLRLGVLPAVTNNLVRFSLDQPAKLSIEINGDITHSLQLFAGAIPRLPATNEPNVRYFGPGVHWPNDEGVPGLIRARSGQTICIAGGAVVRGRIATDPKEGTHDLRILGRGILLGEDDVRTKAGLVDIMYNCHSIELAGLHLLDSYGWTVDVRWTRDARLSDLRLIGYRGNSDGIDIGSCSNVIVEDCFIRSADDPLVAITIGPDSHRPGGGQPGYAPDLENVTFRRCALWVDRDGPDAIHVGWDMFGRRMGGIRFQQIDVLHTRGGDLTGQLTVDSSWWGHSNTLIEDVLFEDICLEDARGGDIFYVRQVNRPCTLRNIRFRRVRVLGGEFSRSSIIVRQPEGTTIEDVLFEDIEILGRKILSASDGRFEIAPRSVRNVIFRPSSTTPTPARTNAPPPGRQTGDC